LWEHSDSDRERPIVQRKLACPQPTTKEASHSFIRGLARDRPGTAAIASGQPSASRPGAEFELPRDVGAEPERFLSHLAFLVNRVGGVPVHGTRSLDSLSLTRAVSVVIPSSRPTATSNLLHLALQRRELSHIKSEIILAHTSLASMAKGPALVVGVRSSCSACATTRVINVDMIALSSEVGCVSRHFAAVHARNPSILFLDAPVLPPPGLLSSLIQRVSLEPGFPGYTAAVSSARPRFYGTTSRRCGANGYCEDVGKPDWGRLSAAQSVCSPSDYRYLLLSKSAWSVSAWLNARFIAAFNASYRGLMLHTHGEGCDIVFNDFARRSGITPIVVASDQTTAHELAHDRRVSFFSSLCRCLEGDQSSEMSAASCIAGGNQLTKTQTSPARTGEGEMPAPGSHGQATDKTVAISVGRRC